MMDISKNTENAYRKFVDSLLTTDVRDMVLHVISEMAFKDIASTQNLESRMQRILADKNAPINSEESIKNLTDAERAWVVTISDLFRIELKRQGQLNTILGLINNEIQTGPILAYAKGLIPKIQFK